MITNPELLSRFKDMTVRDEKMDYPSCLRLFEGLWREGVALGVLPPDDPLEGIEVDIRLARILNHV